MGSCCAKRDPSKVPSSSASGPANTGSGITSNEVPKMIEFSSKLSDSRTPLPDLLDPDTSIICLIFPKDQLKTFVLQLSKLIGSLKQKTNKIFVPVSIQASPLNPNADLIVMMRAAGKVERFIYNEDLPMDENLVAKRF